MCNFKGLSCNKSLYLCMSCDLLFSHLGYSSDRQLSLDLVNVGRQRLDFLPMLEHSGTYRESAVHSGTFAQEIITLVHQVKGQEPMDWPGCIFCILAQNWFWLTVCLFVLQKVTLGAKASHLINDLQMNSIIHSRMSLRKKKRRRRRSWEMWDQSWIGTHANYLVFYSLVKLAKASITFFIIIIIYIKG